MKLIKFEDFERQVNFFCKTLGIEAYDKPGVRNTKSAYINQFLMYFILLDVLLALISEISFVIISFKSGENILEAITTLTYLGFGIVGSYKIITIFLKKPQLNQLASELYSLFPKTLQEQNKMEIKGYLRQCTFTSILYASLNMMLTWSYNLAALFAWLFFGAEKEIPYTMEIPWDWHDHWSYYFIYAAQVLAGYSSTAGQMLSDLLLFALSTQVIMHYDNVARNISAYNLNVDAPNETTLKLENHHEQDLLYLKNMVAYHVRILSLSDIMNDIFGVPLLINFLSSTAIICFVGFEMTVGDSDLNTMIRLFLFMSVSLLQVFLICQYGQQLIDSSTNISNAVFSHNWSNADIRYKKMLSLMIARAQKPAILKATSFVSVSRNTMAELMKISYNFFALLRTMYAE